MPSAYAHRSSSGGSAYAHPGRRTTGAVVKKKGHSGVLGLVENLGADVAHSVAGIPMGVVETVRHPVRSAENIATSYKQTYGPLLHGDVAKFLHNIYEHPLGPALDLATVVTLGAGGLAKAGVLPAEARTLELRMAGQEGKVLTKMTSRNPVIRARQTAIHHALNRLPHDFPHFGETLRFGRELERAPRHMAVKYRAAMRGYNQATKNLSNEEFAALHIIGRGVHPDDWLTYLRQQGHVQPEMLKVLDNPKVRELVDHPDQHLLKAVAAARDLSRMDAELKIQHGILTPESAAARPSLHQRTVEEALGRPVKDTGHEPFYVPDVAKPPRVANADFQKMGGGLGVPKTPGSMRQNKGVLFRTGQLVLHPDLLGPEFLRTIKYGLFDDIHSELLSAAAKIEKGQPLPEGWEYLRRPIVSKTGNRRAEKIHPVIGSAGERQRSLQELIPDPEDAGKGTLGEGFTTKDTGNAAELHDHYLIVPSKLAKQVAGEFTRSNQVVRNFLDKPTKVWRALVLGFRVGFLTNNVVGNHLLYAIHAAGIDGLRAYLNAVKREKGPGVVRSLLEDKKLPPTLRAQFMDEFFPEQVQGTFGATQRPGASKLLSGKKGRKVRAATVGILPATQAVAESNLRRGLVETYIRKSPEFKKVYRGMPRQTREFEAAAKKILRGEGGHEYQRRISEQVNNVLGDYLNLGPMERNVLRAVFPFYGWYKAITRIGTHLALDTPGRADLLQKIGEVGVAATEQELGNLPAWLQGLIPVGQEHAGQHKVLTTGGLNPFQTLTQLGQGVSGVLTGKPGDTGRAFSQLGPNPLLLAAIENMAGKQLFTGRDLPAHRGGILGDILRNVGTNLPQTQLEEALRGQGRTSKTYGETSAREALLAFLGVPLKELDVRQAQSYATGR